MNVSFAGCGFLGIYHVGVASCFKTYAPQILLDKVSGASAGAIAALALLGDTDLGEMASHVIQVSVEARERYLGPFSPSFNINKILYEGLNRLLPDNVAEKVNGRLHISLTRVYDGKNMLVNQFSSKEEVIQVVLASTFIPVFSGWLPPRYRGVRVIDGGYSDNLPVPDSQTITVSPFAGSSDICPQDDSWWNTFQVNVANQGFEVSVENMFRLGSVLLPPEPEVLARMCKQGFDDTLRFIQNKYLISCTRCLTLQSTYREVDTTESMSGCSTPCGDHDPNCLDCNLQRHLAGSASITDNEQVWQSFENAISQAEAGLSSHLINYSVKVVKLLSKPAGIPINVASSCINRLTSLTSKLTPDLKVTHNVKNLIDQLYVYVSSGGYHLTNPPTNHTARYTCEFNIKQYGEEEQPSLSNGLYNTTRDLLNLGFTAHLQSNSPHELPHNKKEAMKFQAENLIAAVGSRSESRAASRTASRVVSRMGSPYTSMTDLHDIDTEAPDTIEQISKVTEAKEAVMSFYYTDADNQVKVTEIFDVTKTDPSLLVKENFGVDYEIGESSPNFPHSRMRHRSEGSNQKIRHNSDSALDSNLRTKRNILSAGNSRGSPLYHSKAFHIGDKTDVNDTQSCQDSDPEADWKIRP